MPKRWCQCTGCPACGNSCRKLYDLDSAPGLRCPACQARATIKRNARPSSSARGLGWAFTRRKQADRGYTEAAVCHWCKKPFTADDPKTADHLTPRSRGGSDGAIVAAHRSCNSSRGGKLGRS
jgi:5-methylcytosine-specific restriction endonuclease McrA